MNITYDIIETKKNDNSDNDNSDNSDSDNSYLNTETEYSLYSSDEILALVTNYNLNYNLSYLNSILEFYKIKKNKKNMKKEQIINMIINFETDFKNKDIVKERIRLFSNFIELKNNEFFNKFIIGSL
jgi:hypothetical protein